MNLFYKIFYLFESFIIFYVATINTIYLFLMVLGFYVLRNRPFTLSKLEYEALQKSSLLPTISVLAPAYNEAKTIADSVRSMLKLNYPNYEVIVINDGSKDETLEILKQEFKLYKSSRQPSGRLHTKPIKTIYESRDPIRLIVIDKENGGKSDSLNVGLDVSRANLTAVVDSDSILETDALLLAVRPFLEDSTTLASGGIIRVANGSAFRYGQITEVSAPNSFLAQLQAVEYLRAFLGGRVAFSFINSLFIISGAFGLFRRSAVIEVGGFSTDTVGEDMELIMRLHHVWRNSK
ncbi:MAG: glycosyltransferase family 2 protein, partial [Blastocatellia bacterium]|nr:glycosyltransferase family 2 protein [Blastocatellia bacterium]